MGVRTDDRNTLRREGKLLVPEIAKKPEFQNAQAQGTDAGEGLDDILKFNGSRALHPPVSALFHSPLDAAFRFSGKAVDSSLMSAVEASNPNSVDSRLGASAGAEFCAA